MNFFTISQLWAIKQPKNITASEIFRATAVLIIAILVELSTHVTAPLLPKLDPAFFVDQTIRLKRILLTFSKSGLFSGH